MISKDANINHRDKVPSKGTVAENWKALVIQRLCIINGVQKLFYLCCNFSRLLWKSIIREEKAAKMLKIGEGRESKEQCYFIAHVIRDKAIK